VPVRLKVDVGHLHATNADASAATATLQDRLGDNRRPRGTRRVNMRDPQVIAIESEDQCS
jgi:hypothetical protein